MEQFSLEEYLKDPSKEVVTRDGRKARIICTNAKSGYPVVALIAEEGSGREDTQTYTEDGASYIGDQSSYDLFFSAPEKHEGWINIYGNSTFYYPLLLYSLSILLKRRIWLILKELSF